jgi:drug/metabolite transporter (DMT)-like permease
MDLSYIFPAVAAFGYSLAAVCSKHALSAGFGVLRLALVINWIFVPVFALLLLRHEGLVPDVQWYLPVLTGIAFFLGQVFTFAAIRMGDVSVQTPVMGSKAVFVVLFAVLMGVELIRVNLVVAAVLSMCAVALLGFAGGRSKRIGRTVVLALLSALFFAGSDTMVAAWGGSFGGPLFLLIVIVTNALLSLTLLPFFQEGLRQIPACAWRWGLVAGVMMAGQALILNYSLATYQNVASANVIYSTRGLWSVVLGALPFVLLGGSAERISNLIRILRFIGAVLMCTAIGILFYN